MNSKAGKALVLNVEKEMLDELMKAARKTDETRAAMFVGLVAGCPVWVFPRGSKGGVL